MINKRNILPAVALLSGALALSPAFAKQHHPKERMFPPADGQNTEQRVRDQDLDSTVARIRKQTGGRVLAAETRFIDGRPVHVIRILTPRGKVRIFHIDARTGKQLP